MPWTTIELNPEGTAKLHHNGIVAVFEHGPLSTAVANAKTATVDLGRVAELIGAPVEYGRMFVGAASSAPSSAVTTLRAAPVAGQFFPTSTTVTGVTTTAPSVVDLRGVSYIDAAITTAEASDSVIVWVTLYGAR